MKRTRVFSLAAGLALCAVAVLTPVTAQEAASTDDDAARFGALEAVISVELSADGKRLVVVGPVVGSATAALVVDLAAGTAKEVLRGDGKPLRIRSCNWSATDRLVCTLFGMAPFNAIRVPATRTVTVGDDGSKPTFMGQRDLAIQYDGFIVDWLNGVDGEVLMARQMRPDAVGPYNPDGNGLGVFRMDTRTGKSRQVERPDDLITSYISDGLGNIRIKRMPMRREQTLLGGDTFFYRKAGSREWEELGVNRATERNDRFYPLAVDPIIDAAYVLQPLEGRLALYRIALDGSKKRELVVVAPDADIQSVVRLGRTGRVIGATWFRNRRHVEYFDPGYQALDGMIAAALPKLPQVQFVSASADEKFVLIRASSPTDPGGYYLLDRERRSVKRVLGVREALAGKTLSRTRTVRYAAGDGTSITAQLTLPPGVSEPRGQPAIVMLNEFRDDWGFEWMAQFFAQRGYLVLRPEYRGESTRAIDSFSPELNGYRNWKTAVGDVRDAGRWLVAEGMVDPARLAVLGARFGGYAALQVNVLQPDLFKAAIAISSVTDFASFKDEARLYTSGEMIADFVGSGSHVSEGSPAQHAEAFRAPVLMFHAVNDYEVNIQQSRRMDKALRAAERDSTLVEYPDLEGSLDDATARADMLRRSDAFLRKHLGL